MNEQAGSLTGATDEVMVRRLARAIQSPHNRHHIAGDDIGTWRARAAWAEVKPLVGMRLGMPLRSFVMLARAVMADGHSIDALLADADGEALADLIVAKAEQA